MLLILAFTSALVAQAPPAPPQRPPRPVEKPLPPGQRIEVRDGDTIVLENGVRVRTIKRRHGNARVVFDAAHKWVFVMFDEETADSDAPDGRVDYTYTFKEVEGTWPFDRRWEGVATWDEYGMADGPRLGFGLDTGGTRVQFMAPGTMPNRASFADASAAQILYRSLSAAVGSLSFSFDETEQRMIDDASRPPGTPPRPGSDAVTAYATMQAGTVLPATQAGTQPLRVGGTIRQPERVVYVPPVMPDQARAAGINGVVIIEATVGPDGSVTNARILRSIPLLDQAALDAVRQWRYTPTLLNGNPVPITMTVTVNFP